MPRHDVHILAVTRVKVRGVEAETDKAAIHKAMKSVDLHDLLSRSEVGHGRLPAHVEDIEWNEEVVGYLVDHEGDEEFETSTYYIDTCFLDSMNQDLKGEGIGRMRPEDWKESQ